MCIYVDLFSETSNYQSHSGPEKPIGVVVYPCRIGWSWTGFAAWAHPSPKMPSTIPPTTWNPWNCGSQRLQSVLSNPYCQLKLEPEHEPHRCSSPVILAVGKCQICQMLQHLWLVVTLPMIDHLFAQKWQANGAGEDMFVLQSTDTRHRDQEMLADGRRD